jgi:hypothetical protein
MMPAAMPRDQYREAARTRTRCHQDAERKNQPGRGCHQRRDRGPECQQDDAAGEHAPRTEAVRDRAGNRLHRTPDELADRHGQADGGDAKPGGGIQRRQKKALRLP